jgi:anti-anti-sigma factor
MTAALPLTNPAGAKVTYPLAGDLTASQVPQVREALKTLIGGGAREIVIDLTETHLIDSSGIGLLVATHNSLARLEGRLAVVNAGPDLLELFKAFRLDKHFSISGLAA